jgi:hypothetical protein
MRAGLGVRTWVCNRRVFKCAITSRIQATSYDAEMYALMLGLGTAIGYVKRYSIQFHDDPCFKGFKCVLSESDDLLSFIYNENHPE